MNETNDDLRDLYQEIILDHNRSPKNFRAMPDADKTIEAFNPLCGDHYTLYLKFNDSTVADVSFEGTGCAISKASASLMSEAVKGMSKAEADELFRIVHRLVTGERLNEEETGRLGKLAAFAGVREYPARVKCASLPWHTLHAAVANGAGASAVVSTE